MSDFNLERNYEFPDVQDNYRLSDANVSARFEVYNLTNIGKHVFDAAIAQGLKDKVKTMVDIGASSGKFARIIDLTHLCRVIGIEPNINQYDPNFTEAYNETIEDIILGYDLQNLMKEKSSDMHMIKASSESIPLYRNSVELVTMMFMAYHLDEEGQEKSFDEVERILVPDGMCIVATSGKDNKKGQRVIEAEIADRLNVERPAIMNDGFTSEKARKFLNDRFDGSISEYNTSQPIQLGEPGSIERTVAQTIIVQSQLSLADQYFPKQNVNDLYFRNVVENVVNETLNTPDFKDEAHRSLFLCSKNPIEESPYFDEIKAKRVVETPMKGKPWIPKAFH